MWRALYDWLTDNWKFVTAIAGLAGFLIYGRRKASLEIQKLTLEVEKLRTESLIYRPTPEEIERIRKETERYSQRTFHISGHSDPMEDFGIELHRFLKQLAAYYHDYTARAQMASERLAAAMQHQPDPYGSDRGDFPFPDAKPLLRLWAEVKEVARRHLPLKTVDEIDLFLNRFRGAEQHNPRRN